MKKLTVLLATLFVFFSADAQQILSGIYSGSMYNDTTKMLTKYELALSEYRGKVFGYSYNTFIVNDTFYYGIRRVKGYKNDKNELILTDEELLANNFPESPAKRIKRTATFQLAQEDTITSLTGSWQTNRTRQYYSVGGATKTERSVDSSQSPLVAHLKELNIISGGPNYQDDAVAKNKKKDEKKPKETKETEKEAAIAKRTDTKNGQGDKPRENRPEVKTTPADNATAANNQPTRGNTNQKDNAVAAADRKEPASGNTDNKPANTAPATTVAANSSAGTNPTTGVVAQPANDQKPAVSGTTTSNNTTTQGTAAPRKEEAVAKATDKPVATSNPAQTAANNNDVDPITGDLVTRKPAAGKPATTASNQPAQNTAAPVSGNAADAAKASDRRAADNRPAGTDNRNAVAGISGPAGTTPASNTAGGPVTTSAQNDKTSTTDKAITQPGNATTGVNNPSGNTAQPAADKQAANNSAAAGNAANSANKPAAPPAAVAALDTRSSAVIKTLEVVNDSITLSFYDNGVVDGDVISVFVNGQNVIASQKLNEVAIKKTVHLTNFAADSVEVTLVAETLGSIPPNTGLVLVHDGDKRYDVRFSADMKTNASIVFRKVKK